MSTTYRQEIETTKALAAWYDAKYTEMQGGWATPPEECHRHLDDLGVPFDKTRKLLDVGAGAGHFLVEAQKRVEAEGIEISEKAIECAYRRGVVKGSMGYVSIEVLDSVWGQYDYITALGSLEHVVDIDKALDNIYGLLKPDGKFYFLLPNDLWPHRDQPNERTFTPTMWRQLFERHGLATVRTKAWGPHQDAYWGYRNDHHAPVEKPDLSRYTGINAGSGQRPFTGGFVNLDIQDKYGPDLVADFNDLSMFADNSMEYVVNHHGVEHAGCGESDAFFKEAYRVLKPGGSLIVCVPDMRALCQRWISHQMDTQLFMTNVYGAFMGDPRDRHAWGFDAASLRETLQRVAVWSKVIPFDWRKIPGADIAGPAFWILGMEGVK
jgi:ubiquinone/menaquinone biosynthesis C-methylase UbiE